jgi:hypothetical protein
VATDAPDGDGAQWLTVVSPDHLNGTALLRGRRSQAAEALQAERREAGTPAVSFTTDDPPAQPPGAHPAGAVFVSEPHPVAYGGNDAVFEDGCGNLLNFHQD